MKSLNELLEGISILETQGDLSVSVRRIQFDSRQVEAGDLFVAVKGSHTRWASVYCKSYRNGSRCRSL